MPTWLLWTLVGLGTWCAVSVPVAFLLAGLFGRTRTESLPDPWPRVHPRPTREENGRDRPRSRPLTRSG